MDTTIVLVDSVKTAMDSLKTAVAHLQSFLSAYSTLRLLSSVFVSRLSWTEEEIDHINRDFNSDFAKNPIATLKYFGAKMVFDTRCITTLYRIRTGIEVNIDKWNSRVVTFGNPIVIFDGNLKL